LRHELLQAARRAPRLLGDATEGATAFLHGLARPDGGYRGRDETSDLYYTVFALDALEALGEATNDVRPFLDGFGDGEGLDLVHLACLARCWAHLGDCPCRDGLLARMDAARTDEESSAYSLFLSLGAMEDLGAAPGHEIAETLAELRSADGGYANVRGGEVGSTPATAAAATLLRHLGKDVDGAVADWLLARQEDGGFKASPAAPIPDLLSTATSLHALAAIGSPRDAIREECLDFLDARWDPSGGFCGSALDPEVDAEYTFYGLLALGHLAT